MSQYDSFTREEFEEELPEGFEEIVVLRTKEYVYEKNLDDEFSIRIHSSVDRRNNKSRDSGKDAIRVSLFHRPTEEIVGYDSRTHRLVDEEGLPTWPKNMRKKIKKLEEQYKAMITECPFCGAPLKRVDKNRGFFGCTKFPECGYTTEADENGDPIVPEIDEKFKRAYTFLMKQHDRDECEICQKNRYRTNIFYDSLYHYLLKNHKLTEGQFECIEDQISSEKTEGREVKRKEWKFPLNQEMSEQERKALDELKNLSNAQKQRR